MRYSVYKSEHMLSGRWEQSGRGHRTMSVKAVKRIISGVLWCYRTIIIHTKWCVLYYPLDFYISGRNNGRQVLSHGFSHGGGSWAVPMLAGT